MPDPTVQHAPADRPGESTPDRGAEHRRQTRSLIALIRAIVRRTSASATSVTDFVAHLNGRLDAIARVQEILMRDPNIGIDLSEIIADEFLRQGVTALNADTPAASLLLERSVAAALALAVHELTTNAIKFGQLNQPARRLRITWVTHVGNDDLVTFTWEEDPLESCLNDPIAAGFGFELIRSTLPYEIGARTRIDLTKKGLRCEIVFCPRGSRC